MLHCTTNEQNSVEQWLAQFCLSTNRFMFKQSFSQHIFSYLYPLVTPTWEHNNYLNIWGTFEQIWLYTSVYLKKIYGDLSYNLCNYKEKER